MAGDPRLSPRCECFVEVETWPEGTPGGWNAISAHLGLSQGNVGPLWDFVCAVFVNHNSLMFLCFGLIGHALPLGPRRQLIWWSEVMGEG